MRLDAVAESIPEKIARHLNLAPVPLAHTHLALLLARSVMEASKAGIFEALAEKARTPAEVAAACGLNPVATQKLLPALATSGYLTYDASAQQCVDRHGAQMDGSLQSSIAERWWPPQRISRFGVLAVVSACNAGHRLDRFRRGGTPKEGSST